MALTPEQLRTRTLGIGSSEAGTVCRLNPYRTWYDLWLSKTGRKPAETTASEAQHFGTLLEPLLAREYTRRTGRRLRRMRKTLVHRTRPYMLAHLDRVVIGEKRIVELKSAGLRMHHQWGPSGTPITDAADGAENAAPPDYIAQITHAMLVYGATRADLVVLIGGNDFRIYPATLDPVFAEALMEREHTFWHAFVVPDQPPPAQTLDDINLMYPHDNTRILDADPDTRHHVDELRTLKKRLKDTKTAIDHHTFQVKNAMGEHRILLNERRRIIATWKHHDTHRLDQNRLKERHPKALADCTTATTQRPLYIK